ncbi:hypothetical protein [Paracidovorax avenae]|uniref:hypothetical protein n=1 Tax=Paracidovorax avenae TaxID=80867 RepID=UPI000B21F649|nr:hypothetical protein [Paracidovorax avenae]
MISSIFPNLFFPDAGLLVRFYVVELSLFEVSIDYGMGSCLIVAKNNPHVGLVISEGDPAPVSSRPLFTGNLSKPGHSLVHRQDLSRPPCHDLSSQRLEVRPVR